MGGDAQVPGADLGQQAGGHDERRDAEWLGVNAEDQVDHGGVAREGDLVDLVRLHAALPRKRPCRQLGEGLLGELPKLVRARPGRAWSR